MQRRGRQQFGAALLRQLARTHQRLALQPRSNSHAHILAPTQRQRSHPRLRILSEERSSDWPDGPHVGGHYG